MRSRNTCAEYSIKKYRGVGGLVLFLLAGGVWFSFWRDWLSKLVCIWGPRDSEGHKGGRGGVGVDRGPFLTMRPRWTNFLYSLMKSKAYIIVLQ